MHLRSVTIRNFRMHLDTTVSVGLSTTVIVGRNNSGKTSIAELFRKARDWLEGLVERRAGGSLGDVVDHLHQADLLTPAAERALRRAVGQHEDEDEDDERTMRLREHWNKLKQVPYEQVRRWHSYESGNTMLSTKHGAKGAQFDEVVVVFGGGWSKYDFSRMLAEWDAPKPKPADKARFERARNLFYVTVSRARYRLALVFLEALSADAVAKLEYLFGKETVAALPYKGG